MKKLALILSLLAFGAQAQTTATDPWVRGTVATQKATGMFVQLTSAQGGKLVAGSSPVAGRVEIHEMAVVDGVMRMREISALELPAGKAVELKPGSYHLMLMDLKAPLAKDSSLSLTLTFKDAKGVETKQQVSVPVATTMPNGHAHGDHKH